jgi:hypothetical protein
VIGLVYRHGLFGENPRSVDEVTRLIADTAPGHVDPVVATTEIAALFGYEER